MNVKHKLLLGACLMAVSGQAWSQETTTASAPGSDSPATGVDEIVVTALRRSERLQDVPVSVTAIGGDALANQHIQQVGDLAMSVPNLQSSNFGGSLPIFSLRGISMSDYSFNQQGPVATYFDEVYKGSWPLLPLAMYDLERVEVLRGPQGTLYGKNTTGGAINFISRKPTFDTEGYLKLGYGNYNRFDADGAVQTALSDTVAARIAFTFSRADGWMNNVLAGKPDSNAVRQYGIRTSFLFKPSDKVDFVLRLSTSLQNPIEYGVIGIPGALGVGNGVYEVFGQGTSFFRTGLGRRETASDNVQRHRQRTYGASLTGNWHVSNELTVTSVTSYDYGKLFAPDESDGSPLKVVASDLRGTGRQFAQDLRLASDTSGPFNFIVGAYYNIEKLRNNMSLRYFSDIDVNGDGTINASDCIDPNAGGLITCDYRNHFRQTKESIAVYGDVNYKLTDRLILRGGLRYTHDKGRFYDFSAQLWGADGTPIANIIPGDPTNIDATTSLNFKKGTISGKVGIDFKTADGDLIYASFSRGYRANSFNAQAFFSPTELNVAKPETVNAYEIGFKSQFLDRAVTLNGAVFYYDYRNQQALSVDSGTLTQNLVNLPKSRIMGGELELTVRPIQGIRLNAGLGVLSSKIRNGSVSGVSLVGNRLTNAPKLTASGSVDWDIIDGDNGKLTWGVNASYASKQYFDLFNTDRIAQKGYVLVGSQLNYRFAGDQYGVGLWVKNIFNQYYDRINQDLLAGFGYDYHGVGDPRTYGVTIDAKF
nr:TonB-dependent receptor [Sphingomonas sp. CDS-1]